MTTPDNPGYGQPPAYGAPPPGWTNPPPGFGGPAGFGPKMSNGLGVAALVIGIISIPFGFIVVGGVSGLLAVALGIAGRSRAKRGEANNGGVALAGIITGIVAFLIAIVVVLVLVVAYNSDTGRKLRRCVNATNGDKVAEQICKKDLGITPTPSSNS